MLIEKVMTDFKEKNGREPTEDELNELLEVMNEQAEANDSPENAEEVVKMLMERVRPAFMAQHGREPTEEELAIVLAKLTGVELDMGEEEPMDHQKPAAAVDAVEYAEEEV